VTRALLLAVALLLAAPARAQQAIDGDTFRIGAESIRILNIDAPELSHPGCASEHAAALRARDRLAELLRGGVVVLRRGRDLYGRTLAIVLDLDGEDIGARLVAEGLARPWDGRRRPWCFE
jgi:endonuclease YncB( thermonuclease family)